MSLPLRLDLLIFWDLLFFSDPLKGFETRYRRNKRRYELCGRLIKAALTNDLQRGSNRDLVRPALSTCGASIRIRDLRFQRRNALAELVPIGAVVIRCAVGVVCPLALEDLLEALMELPIKFLVPRLQISDSGCIGAGRDAVTKDSNFV